MVRVARMDENLFLLLEPAQPLIPGESQVTVYGWPESGTVGAVTFASVTVLNINPTRWY